MYPGIAETFFPSVFSKEEQRRGNENSLDYARVLLMTQKPSFNVSVNSKTDHPPTPPGEILDWLVTSLNTQMIIILRQFFLQLIL